MVFNTTTVSERILAIVLTLTVFTVVISSQPNPYAEPEALMWGRSHLHSPVIVHGGDRFQSVGARPALPILRPAVRPVLRPVVGPVLRPAIRPILRPVQPIVGVHRPFPVIG